MQKWPNVLLLCEVIFSLPFSNGVVERIFSILKVIKTEKCTNLSVDTLRDLLEIKVEEPGFDDFKPQPAIKLWWKGCKTQEDQTRYYEKITDHMKPVLQQVNLQLQRQLTQQKQNIPVRSPLYFPRGKGFMV